jgi:hypothetical protein
LRVEADHVAWRDPQGEPTRTSLFNGVSASGEAVHPEEARSLAEPLLPFEDDGGMAAVLVGRLLSRGARSAR